MNSRRRGSQPGILIRLLIYGVLTAVPLAGAAASAAQPALRALASDSAGGRTIQDFVAGFERRDGLATVYLDHKGGRVLLALEPAGSGANLGQFLYQVYLRSGLGSAPVGLDRSAATWTQIITFRRMGHTVYAELENSRFRADAGSAAEHAAVHDSFAASLVWSGSVLAEDADGRVLVDLSSFLTADAFGVVETLSRAKQGDFKRDHSLSYPDLDACQAFPENLEFEAIETFTSDRPGPEVEGIAPEPHSVTLSEHHSLIKLPELGYQPRLADPRTGAISTLVADFSTPLAAPVVYRLAHRFRLEKTDPTAARSTVKKPIVFYVDRAAPEPVRSALVDGARWWAEAFDAAGFIDAFRVEVLPEGVSPLDARYNVINWVHRQTRGWSYGQNVIDPRTGEIIKGAVLLGSLRVRQDRLIFEGLAGAGKTGSGAQDDPVRISLARLRQLAVHETGHALGLEHNFAGSSYDDRASVMDYPAPRVVIRNGQLDFGDAYKVGIGSWDRFAIHWLYDEAAPGTDQSAGLEAIVADGYAHGQRFVADDDARPTRSAHPHGALWDDGADAVAELEHVLAVRRIALSHFGADNLPRGAPLADLRRLIVPVYLFHRYQVDAAAKSVGGSDFTYATSKDGLRASVPVPGGEQRRALAALLGTLAPAVLDLPAPLIDLLSAGGPSPHDPQFTIEVFGEDRAPSFSLERAVTAAADITLDNLLEPSRLNRVLEQASHDPSQLSLGELMATTVAAAFPRGPNGSGGSSIRHFVQGRLVAHLATVLNDKSLSPTAAAIIQAALSDLGRRLATVRQGAPADVAVAHYYAELLQSPNADRLRRLAENDSSHSAPPPGMPIGAPGEDDWFSDGAPQ